MEEKNASYIAGFLDGDGSIRLQIQPRKNSKLGFRARTIISFAQKTGHKKELSWIRKQLKIGYIYERNDGMEELKIEGFDKTERILKILYPYVHFKKKQTAFMLKALKILKNDQSSSNFMKVVKIADSISKLNYVTTKKRYTAEFVSDFFQKNAPVTTDPDEISGEISEIFQR